MRTVWVVLRALPGTCRLKAYLDDMRGHMPPPHREFLRRLEQLGNAGGGGVAAESGEQQPHCVRALCSSVRSLAEPYNDALAALTSFR